MFWEYFSNTFGIIFGFFMAVLAFVFLIALLDELFGWLRRRRRKRIKNCVRCKAMKNNPKAFSYCSGGGTELCDKCQKEDAEDD